MKSFSVGDESFIDEKTGLRIKLKEGTVQCSDLDISKSSMKSHDDRTSPEKELQFTCEESEALYSIGFQKVSEHCRNEGILKYHVDWGVCLNAYYPWVDMLQTKICVLKHDHRSDFLACFCDTDGEGNVTSRGFCITKIECVMNGHGTNSRRELSVEQVCLNNIRYFLEANARDNTWLSQARKNDKLRVRAPYHPDSPCFEQQFSGHFDIGQLEFVELHNGKIELMTPFLLKDFEVILNKDQKEKMFPTEKTDDIGTCPEILAPMSEEAKQRIEHLSFFFVERIYADTAIWAPGIIFVYSTMFEEKGKIMKLITWIISLSIISIGFYNSSVAFLPEAYFSVLEEFRQTQVYLFLFSFLLSSIVSLSSPRAVPEHFLMISVISLLPDIFLWKVAQVMYTEERLSNYKMLVRLWFLALTLYSVYKLYLFVKSLKSSEMTADAKSSTSNISKRKKEAKKVVKIPFDETLSAPTKSPTQKKRNKGKKSKKDKAYSILCQFKCFGIDNIGYVSVNCTETCFNQFHSQCWSKFLQTRQLEGEAALLGQNCLTQLCSGKIFEIVWVDKCGIETSRKYVYADLNTVQQGSKQRGARGKQKLNITRSLSDSSGASGSSETRSHDDKRLSSKLSGHPKLQQSKSLDYKHLERPMTPKQDAMPLRTFLPSSVSYASMVKNNNNVSDTLGTHCHKNTASTNQNNSEILDEILELNCPEILNQNCKLPEKSKILSLIAKSKESDVFGGGPATKSSALVFVPGATARVTKPVDNQISAVREQEQQATNKRSPSERKKVDSSRKNHFEASQFTKIMAKHFPDYTLWEVDRAVKEVSSEKRLEELTIPIFKKMIQDKLDEADENEIFMSDEEAGCEEECPICTEPLECDLRTLTSCSHVFHDVCISEWLNKDLTCPKCRAIVEINK